MTWSRPESISHILSEHHYLGPIRRGIAWQDDFGVIVVTTPTARHIPKHWLELARWCIVSKQKNSGSMQWSDFIRALRKIRPDITTIVSYSDPSAGHTGALYRACNWWWAPTWHRVRPPPSGNGSWNDHQQSVKDRWIFPVRKDRVRALQLKITDDSVLKANPWALYKEPGGVPWRQL